MKTDRELLELAAKAAGVTLHVWGTPGAENFADMGGPGGVGGKRWNPLNDDGDALRLAVKLGISVSFAHNTGLDIASPAIVEVSAFAGWCPTFFEANHEDWAAATRRAIVRAAAAIGEHP